MLWWARCGFHKKCVGTRYPEHVFLHPVRCAGHIVHSCESGVRNLDALFFFSGGPIVVSIKSALRHVMPNLCFYIQWDMWVTECIPVHPGHETSTCYFSCSSEPSRFP
jgi:hypothetical protein